MDSASEFLFNSCVHSLRANLPYPHNVAFPPPQLNTPEARAAIKFTDAFSDAMVRISQREVLGRIWPLFEIFGDKTAEPMRAISEYLDPVIHAAMEKKRLAGPIDKNDDSEELSLLDDLLNTTSGTPAIMHNYYMLICALQIPRCSRTKCTLFQYFTGIVADVVQAEHVAWFVILADLENSTELTLNKPAEIPPCTL
jgi:hypothetical protein